MGLPRPLEVPTWPMPCCRRAARESIVLLNNSAPPSRRLPWAPAALRSVAVVGAYANSTSALAGGKPDYQTRHFTTLLDGLRARFGNVSYSPAYSPSGVADQALQQEAVAAVAAPGVDAAVVVVGIRGSGSGAYDEHESHDRTFIGLPPDQLKVVQAA